MDGGPAELTRRLVTVLFADLVGSTGIGERLDPEAFRAVQVRLAAASRASVERHGGRPEKYAGDSIMAVFGLPVAHEDDALRATRAAVELRDQVRAMDADVGRRLGVELRLRVGLESGEVAATADAGAGELLVSGDTVNVAARLQAAAGPDEIVVGDRARRLLGDAAELHPLGDLELRGRAAPTTAHRLVDLVDRPPQRSRLDIPMIGREAELRVVVRAFREAVDSRRPRSVTIVGAAGVGKSRLVHESIATIGPGATIVRGRCLPYGQGITYWPLRDLVFAAASIDASAPLDESVRRLAAVAGSGPDGQLVATRLAAAVGLADTSVSDVEIAWATRRLLERMGQATPVVAVIDDLQWAEPAFLDLFEHIVDSSTGGPILVVGVARPEFLEQRPTWRHRSDGDLVELAPLDGDGSTRLVETLIAAHGASGVPTASILQAAEGNPLFLEQYIAMLADERERSDGSPGVAALAVPPTISALLAARLDRLPSASRALLARAAVIGRVFWLDALSALAPDEARPTAETVAPLVDRGLLRPDVSVFPGDLAYRFHHLLVRDAAYAALAKSSRAELHVRFADWLEARTADRASEYGEIVGHHLEQAVGYRSELGYDGAEGTALRRRAGRHLGEAGGRAQARGDVGAARTLLGRSVELLPEDDPTRDELLELLARSLRNVDRAAGQAVHDEVIARAEASGRPVLAARARIARAWARTGDDGRGWDELLEELERAIPVFEANGAARDLVRALRMAGHVRSDRGRLNEEARFIERAQAVASDAGLSREAADLDVILADRAGYSVRPVGDSIRLCDHALTAVEPASFGRGLVLAARAHLLAMVERFDDAWADIDEARRTAEEIAMPLPLGAGDVPRRAAWVARLQRRPELALPALETGIATLAALDERPYRATVEGHRGRLLLELGQHREALGSAEASRAHAAPDDLDVQVRWRLVRARALVAIDPANGSEALALVSSAGAMAGRTHDSLMRTDLLADRAEILIGTGRPNEARRDLHAAAARVRRKGDVAWGRMIGQRLRDLEGVRDDGAAPALR